MSTSPLPNHLDVHPSVVFQLGETLISDEIQAIVELVKNAYDADATWSRVSVDTELITSSEDSFFPGCRGQIVVEDDGTGMNATDIERGWLIVADSSKREAKQRGRVTPKFKRTPLGDKGLGRLGVQRLGYVVELLTAKTAVLEAPSNGSRSTLVEEPEGAAYHVGIDWREFACYQSLSEVPVRVKELPREAWRRGTRIAVSELRDPSVWASGAITELQRKLSQVIFPFGNVRPFRVIASVNGDDLDLLEISDLVRDAAHSRFRLTYAEGILSVEGHYKLTAFQPPNSREQAEYNALMLRDRGRTFFEHLSQSRTALSRTGAEYLADGPWFLRTYAERRLDRLGDIHYAGDELADPGPFDGEIDVFALGGEAAREVEEELFRGFKDIVRSQSGVRIFRDGFAVRPYGIDGNDWLGLGSGWTRGRSFHGLRPGNVIGYISISAKDNAQLIEKTDREGFAESPHSRNFLRLMREATDTINTTITVLRRDYTVFRDASDLQSIGMAGEVSPDVLFDRIRSTARGATQLRTSVERLERTLEQSQRAAVAITEKVPAQQNPEIGTLIAELRDLLTNSRDMLSMIDDHAQRASALGTSADMLERDLARVREQLDQFSELAALGLTAEAVSHEMRTVASNLATRTSNVLAQLRKRQVADADVLAYTEHVRGSVFALRKQLSHLAPALRYVREQVDSISLRPFLVDLQEFHSQSFARDKISIELEEPIDDFVVRMNRGKLTQVLDNLFLNSRYWLRHDLNARRISTGIIHVRTSRPSLFVWDSGRGIDPALEDTLFEPFVTNKPKGRGRGLGLFIARQLLESSGCSIVLLPDRNEFGSRYVFEINLAGAMNGDR